MVRATAASAPAEGLDIRPAGYTPGSGGSQVRKRGPIRHIPVAAALASLGFSTATQAAAFPVRGRVPAVIKTITVGARPDGIAVSPVTGEIYIANYSGSTVSVISPLAGTVIKTITFGNGLCCTAINPVTGQVYISSADTNQVFILNGRTNDLASTLTTGPGPAGIAFNPQAGTVYLVISGDNQVSVLDSRTNQVIATVDVGDHPDAAAYSPLTNSVYVTNLDDNTVSVIGSWPRVPPFGTASSRGRGPGS
jgi:YVTN family beta-propeller protein